MPLLVNRQCPRRKTTEHTQTMLDGTKRNKGLMRFFWLVGLVRVRYCAVDISSPFNGSLQCY